MFVTFSSFFFRFMEACIKEVHVVFVVAFRCCSRFSLFSFVSLFVPCFVLLPLLTAFVFVFVRVLLLSTLLRRFVVACLVTSLVVGMGNLRYLVRRVGPD